MTIDYSLNSVYGVGNKTGGSFKRIAKWGCTIDLRVVLNSGEVLDYNIDKMRGSKPLEVLRC